MLQRVSGILFIFLLFLQTNTVFVSVALIKFLLLGIQLQFLFISSHSEVQPGLSHFVRRRHSQGFSFVFLSTGELLPTEATRPHKIVDSGPNLVAGSNGQPLLSSPAVEVIWGHSVLRGPCRRWLKG